MPKPKLSTCNMHAYEMHACVDACERYLPARGACPRELPTYERCTPARVLDGIWWVLWCPRMVPQSDHAPLGGAGTLQSSPQGRTGVITLDGAARPTTTRLRV